MDPDGIDDSIVPHEVIEDLKENENRTLDRHGLPFLLTSRISKVRQIYEASKTREIEEPYVIRSFSRELIEQ